MSPDGAPSLSTGTSTLTGRVRSRCEPWSRLSASCPRASEAALQTSSISIMNRATTSNEKSDDRSAATECEEPPESARPAVSESPPDASQARDVASRAAATIGTMIQPITASLHGHHKNNSVVVTAIIDAVINGTRWATCQLSAKIINAQIHPIANATLRRTKVVFWPGRIATAVTCPAPISRPRHNAAGANVSGDEINS